MGSLVTVGVMLIAASAALIAYDYSAAVRNLRANTMTLAQIVADAKLK